MELSDPFDFSDCLCFADCTMVTDDEEIHDHGYAEQDGEHGNGDDGDSYAVDTIYSDR